MKKSKVETAQTRDRIVKTAAAEFRRNGIHASGLNDVMAAAGLTHGGFYRHFDSKDQLLAEACAVGGEAFAEMIESAASAGDGKNSLQAIVEAYLSPKHRDDREGCCPVVSLGSELARADEATRAIATEGFLDLVDFVAKRFPGTKPEVAKAKAIVVLCAMMGAVTMSRVVVDPDLSDEILLQMKKHLTGG